MNTHIISHHILLTKQTAVKCSKCNISYKTNEQLQKHILSDHLLPKEQMNHDKIENAKITETAAQIDTIKTFSCNQCENKFSNPDNMKKHIRSQHEKREESHDHKQKSQTNEEEKKRFLVTNARLHFQI